MKHTLLSLVMVNLVCLAGLAFSSEGDPSKPYYQPLVPGVPVGGGKVLGGLYDERTPPTPEPEIIEVGAESQKSADTWQALAKWTAIGAVVLTFAWYVMKSRMVAGMAVLSLVVSFACTIMAEIVSKAWAGALLAIILVLVIGIGYAIRNKSVIEWWRNKGKRKPAGEDAERIADDESGRRHCDHTDASK